MTHKVMRFVLGAVFLSSGVRLLAFGLGFVLHEPGWAWNNTVMRVFIRLGPMLATGFSLGTTLDNMRVAVVCFFAGAALYLAAGFSLLFPYSQSRKLVASACWINAISLLLRIFDYIKEGEFHSWLLLDAAALLAYVFLGLCVHRGRFARSENTSEREVAG